MNVSWNRIPLSEARGFIVKYHVLYNKVATKMRRQTMVSPVPVPGSETNALIGDLDPSFTYEVYVSAETSAGEGEYTGIPVVVKSKLITKIWCLIINLLYCLHKFTCVKYVCVVTRVNKLWKY